jgi:hypothetical protein
VSNKTKTQAKPKVFPTIPSGLPESKSGTKNYLESLPAFLTFPQVDSKMKFNLYFRGIRITVKEGRLLPLGRFEWMKFHYKENTKKK